MALLFLYMRNEQMILGMKEWDTLLKGSKIKAGVVKLSLKNILATILGLNTTFTRWYLLNKSSGDDTDWRKLRQDS